TSVELDVHALFQNIGTQATKRYFLPRLGRVAYFSRYKVGDSPIPTWYAFGFRLLLAVNTMIADMQ
ncbi:MAG: hypothetical protein EWV53_05335, partial [Microcystis panniformis Mp_MB_F_20051200_S9]